MIEHPVDFNFVDDCGFTVLLGICGLFGEGFNSVLFAILQSLAEVH